MRSYSASVTTVINGFAYYEWDFTIVLNQEEIQYIYYSYVYDEATTGDADYPPYYIIYLDGIKYITVYPTDAGQNRDQFINFLNEVRVLSQKTITIQFFQYIRANFAPCNGTYTLSFKTVK
jgi:hypothetical protein